MTIKLIGTPAEESGGGAVLLLQRGVFDDVAMAMAMHPTLEDTCACSSPAVDDLDVRHTGGVAQSSGGAA